MQFVATEEQALIQETARNFFQERVTSAGVREVMESEAGYDRRLWHGVMAEMGFGGIALPAECGGAGLGHVELAIILMEMGRTLCPSPFLSSVAMAAPAILVAGDETQKARWLPGIASGETIAALGWQEDGAATLSEQGGGCRLSGSARYVPYGHVADLFVIPARGAGGGLSLLAVPAGTPGVRVEKHVAIDLTRPLATLHFEDVAVPADMFLGEPGGAAAAFARTLDLARVALAAEQAGGAEALLDMTVQYAKDRVQFGRPIGSFQAIKHRLADMMVQVETAKTAAFYAACVADENNEGLPEAAAIAKAYCSDAYLDCAGNAIQLHGGIGFTWEHDAHLYFKRARGSATLLGDGAAQRETVARILKLGEEN